MYAAHAGSQSYIILEVIFFLALLHRVEIMAFPQLLVQMHCLCSIQVSKFSYLFPIQGSDKHLVVLFSWQKRESFPQNIVLSALPYLRTYTWVGALLPCFGFFFFFKCPLSTSAETVLTDYLHLFS